MAIEAFHEQTRQFRRHETSFRAYLEPVREHGEKFRLAIPDAQTGLAVVDVSEGGLGLRSNLFLPRNLRVALQVWLDPQDHESPAPPLRIHAVVRRCTLVDYKPTYQIGMQFIDAGGIDEQRLIAAVREARRSAAALQAVAGGAAP
jgi:hypothetical protein